MNVANVQRPECSDQGPPFKVHRSTWMILVVALTVAVVTFGVHWPCVRNEFLNWDDDIYLAEAARHPSLNWPTIAWAFSTTVPFYYHPLTFLSHVADGQLWGRDPSKHHLTNLFWHGLNSGVVALFVWLVLATVTTSLGERLAMAGGVALVFGLHPLQVEPVAWVAERKTLLCAFFSLLTLCAYLQAVRPGGTDHRAFARAQRRWWWITVALFGVALLSKPMAMTLPLVMLALDFCPLRRHEILGWRALWREKTVLIGLSVVDLVLTAIGQAGSGAVMTAHGHNVWDRCLVAVRGVVFYLWKLIWPGRLYPFYPLGGTMSLSEAEFLVPSISVAATSVAALWLRRRAPALPAAWCAYLAVLLPVSGLLQVGMQAVADRFAYLAMLAPLLALGWGGVLLWRRMPTIGRLVLFILVCCDLVFLTAQTRRQIQVWRDSETLWTTVLERYPRSGVAEGHLAMALAQQRRFEEALPHARASLADIPDYPLARKTLEDACSTLAMARVERRQFAEALPFVTELVASDPTNSTARAILGLIRLKTGQYAEAISELEEALRLNAELPAARYNLACAYSRTGRFADAYAALRNLLPSQPQFGPLAARDADLAALRDAPEYGPLLKQLLPEDGAQ